jgi:hypothetical protein
VFGVIHILERKKERRILGFEKDSFDLKLEKGSRKYIKRKYRRTMIYIQYKQIN